MKLKLSLLSGSYLSAGFLEPSVAQPPLPLQEFLPLQPLSPALQPPLPLQLFWPLHACFSLTFLSALLASSWAAAFPAKLAAFTVVAVPASRPAIAAPANRYLFDLVISFSS